MGNQANGARIDRAWAYFEPEPEAARARKPVPSAVGKGDWFRVGSTIALSAAAIGYLDQIVLTTRRPLPILGAILMLVAGLVGMRIRFGWRYKAARLRFKDDELRKPPERSLRAPRGGFADKVDRAFDEYFVSRAPKQIELVDWLADTSGIRWTLREEIVEIYRDSKVRAENVRWLIRDLVDEVARSWTAGTQRDYRKAYRTTPGAKALCCASLVVSAIAALPVVATAISARTLVGLLAIATAIWAGRIAVRYAFRIYSEKMRHAEDERAYEQTLVRRRESHRLWKELLDRRRPDEQEMEAWLYCDTMVLLGNTLRHYKLAWQNVVAHAFLQAPSKECRRARTLHGPWRYSRYDIRLFVVTDEGVREVCGELNFEAINFDSELRRNYRFEAVSSVDVSRIGKYGRDLGLTLNNGPTRNIHVNDREAVAPLLDTDEDPEQFARINLDTTGFTHTLHILEGIAAEGKEWMQRDPYAHNAAKNGYREADSRNVGQ